MRSKFVPRLIGWRHTRSSSVIKLDQLPTPSEASLHSQRRQKRCMQYTQGSISHLAKAGNIAIQTSILLLNHLQLAYTHTWESADVRSMPAPCHHLWTDRITQSPRLNYPVSFQKVLEGLGWGSKLVLGLAADLLDIGSQVMSTIPPTMD